MAANLGERIILIVDDNPNDQLVLHAHLEAVGLSRLLLAGSGAEALDQLAANRVDLALLDVQMPGMNGFEVVERIRAEHPDRHLPIILVSASVEPSDRVRGIEVGANDFIVKPVDGRELVARVTALLGHKRVLDDLKAERERLEGLYHISQALTSYLDYQHTIREIVSLAPQLIPATKAILVLLDENGEFQQKIVSHPGQETISVDTIERAILDRGLIGWVLQHKGPVLVDDVSADERWTELPGDEPAGSAIAAALTWGERTIGALMLESPSTRAFGDEHASLIAALGSQAAIALENARLYEQMQQEQMRTEALLNQIGTPVVVTDPAGRITRTNPAADEIFGLGLDVLRKPLAEVFGLTLADLLLRAQERSGTVSGEYSRRTVTGERRAFNVSISPIAEVGYLLVLQDITGLKESERVRLESERAETQRVLSAFSRYMSTALIEKVLTDRDILTRRERREAVVLFADLRGFTRLTVEHPPDEVFALLNDLFSEMLEIVNQHEGLVFDITGDELMIAFNVPYPQEDPNRRALRTAIDMQKRFGQLQRKWREEAGMEIGMGIGINRGTVVLGHIGGSSHMNYSMIGEAVNIGHRLVEIAEDAQIVVTPEVLSEGLPESKGVRLQELKPRLLKGKSQPQAMTLITLGNGGSGNGKGRKKVK